MFVIIRHVNLEREIFHSLRLQQTNICMLLIVCYEQNHHVMTIHFRITYSVE